MAQGHAQWRIYMLEVLNLRGLLPECFSDHKRVIYRRCLMLCHVMLGQKVKFSLCLPEHHTMKTYGGWRYVSRILNLGLKWR
jgi:hypothetical protein